MSSEKTVLSDVLAYVKQHRVCHIQSVSEHFALTEEAAEALLAFWCRRGAIKEHACQQACLARCSGCSSAQTTAYYHYCESETAPS